MRNTVKAGVEEALVIARKKYYKYRALAKVVKEENIKTLLKQIESTESEKVRLLEAILEKDKERIVIWA